MSRVTIAALVAHVVVVVVLLGTVAVQIGLLWALGGAALVTVVWIVWARRVDIENTPHQPVGLPQPARFTDPEET